MTDARTRQRVSYAEVLRRQAAQVDNVADQYALVMDGGEYDTSEVQPARLDAAALRALAALVERLQGLRLDYSLQNLAAKSRANDWNQTAHIGYHEAFEALHDVVTEIQTGFDPDGPR